MLKLFFRKQNSVVTIDSKSVKVTWTAAANRRLLRRIKPLIVEMEMRYSCMPVKLVHFHDTSKWNNLTYVNDKLGIFFHASISGKVARNISAVAAEDSSDVLTKPTPRQLFIDFRKGQWYGEFNL